MQFRQSKHLWAFYVFSRLSSLTSPIYKNGNIMAYEKDTGISRVKGGM